MSRHSEEYLKSPLTDVSEENELDFLMEKLSRSSISPDVVFARPPKVDRKISNGSMGGEIYLEATGRRRSSDHGVILTADTDSFIIGQKVWVGGIRPGQIAYIGETHFAPGEWAGVVLDEPNGKNDGCVSGKRYFQCEPKKGIFSRLTRLTHYPLPNAFFGKEPSPGQTTRSLLSPERSRTTSPTSSIRSSMLKSPNKQGMMVGDRVIVSSGLGSRPGILKYMGETKFSQGNWCGIQLDEPTGKNDGSVDGVRYFECPAKYGIFVPIAKVSLSPSSRKSRLSRAGSKESLTSVGTLNSIATTNTSRLRMSAQKIPSVTKIVSAPKNTFSMQDMIREKQNHIEQLMIERDLDREDAQNQALNFQKNITELRGRVAELEKLLQNEKKKTEELQYNIDEAQFCGDELNAQTQVYKEKISELEQRLLPSSQANSSEHESKYISEIGIIKQENEKLVKDLQTLQNKIEDYELKIANSFENEEKMKEQLEYCSNENEEMRKELVSKDERAEKLYLNVKELQNTLSDETVAVKQSVLAEEAKYSQLLKSCDEKNALITKLTSDTAELNQKIESMNKEKQDLTLSFQKLEQENELIKGELTKTSSEFTKINGMYQEKIDEYKQLQQKIDLSKLDDENLKMMHNNLASQNEQLKANLQAKNQEILELTNGLSEVRNSKEELSKVIAKFESNLSEVSNSRSILEAELITKEQEADMNKILIEELNTKLKSLEKHVSENQNMTSKLSEDVTARNDEINKYKSEFTAIQKELETVKNQLSSKQEELLQKTNESDEKSKSMENIEKEYKGIVAEFDKSRSEFSTEINKLNKRLEFFTNTESTLDTLQQNFTTVQDQKETLAKTIDEMKQEFNSLKDENTANLTVIKDQSNKLEEYTALVNSKQIECDQLNNGIQVLNKQCEDFKQTQKSLQSQIAAFELENGDLSRQKETLNQKCNEITNQHQVLQEELSNLRNTSSDTNSEIVRLTTALVEKQKDYNELLDSSNAARNKIEKELHESIQNVALHMKEIENMKANSQLMEENMSKLQIEIDALKDGEKKKDIEIENLKLELESEKENVAKIVSASSNESESLKTQLDLQITCLQKELNTLETELGNTKENVKTREESLLKQIEEYGNEKEKLFNELKEIKDNEISLRSLLDKQKEDGNTSIETLTSQLHEKDNQIDSLKGTITMLQESSENISSKLSNTEVSFESLQAERDKLTAEAKKNSDNIEQLKALIVEKENDRLSILNQNEELQGKLSVQESDRNEAFNNLETFKNENLSIITSLKDDVSRKESENASIDRELKQERENIANLRNNFEEISENLKQELSLKDQELKTKIEDILLLNQRVEQLQTDLNKNKTELNEITLNFTAQINNLNKIIAEKTEENLKLLQDVSESKDFGAQKENLSVKLVKEMEQQKTLLEKYELLKNEHNECHNKITELENSLKESHSMFDTVNSKVTKLELEQNAKQNSAKVKQTDYEKLLNEYKQLSSTEKTLKDEISVLRAEKQKQSLISQSIGDSGGTDCTAQINFLNSIIADMQKKNETLKARIDTLESIPIDFTQSAAFNLVGKRNPAPRLFCDICDEFDAHDTEDCPLQSSDSPPPPVPMQSEKAKKLPPPRKYCETCEAFGHDTEECVDEETY